LKEEKLHAILRLQKCKAVGDILAKKLIGKGTLTVVTLKEKTSAIN